MASLKNFSPLLIVAPLLLGTLSCDNIVSQSGQESVTPGCSPNQAELIVYDNFIQSLCGCQEGAVIQTPPEGITCTVAAGTSVWFWFLDVTQLHQIQSTAQPTFQTSSVVDPSNSNTVRTHVVKLTATGNYEFQDNYNRTINGTIIVQ